MDGLLFSQVKGHKHMLRLWPLTSLNDCQSMSKQNERDVTILYSIFNQLQNEVWYGSLSLLLMIWKPSSDNHSPIPTSYNMLSNAITPSWTTFTFLGTERWLTVRISYYVYQKKANEFLLLFQYLNRLYLFYFWCNSTLFSVRIFFCHPVYVQMVCRGNNVKALGSFGNALYTGRPKKKVTVLLASHIRVF